MVTPLTHLSIQSHNPTPGKADHPWSAAAGLFTSACHNSWINLFRACLTGTKRGLLTLEDSLDDNVRLLNAYYKGVSTVPLGQIVGSEGRGQDFDRDFNPTNENTRDRWISVAAARLQGNSLPLVELIQIGERYFVRDGHHRVSVARALKQEYIEALVTVWEIGLDDA
jgi:hypothetical protein